MDYLRNLERNDKDYIEGLEALNDQIKQIADNPPKIYNPAQFQEPLIINLLIQYKILRDKNICPKCGDLMKMVEHKASIDNLIWRCHKRLPPHDIKINIRNGSIFEGLQIKITVLYFLLYFCFIENMSINESVSKCNGFCVQVGETNTTAQSVSKFYAQVRSRLRQKCINHGNQIL